MHTKPVFIFALILLVSAGARAEELFDHGGVKIDVAVSPTYVSCFKAADGNDLSMAACITAETASWDRRLNAAYSKLRAQLSKTDFAALQAFQRLWVGERDAACRDDGQNGTPGRVDADSCVLRVTALRVVDLEMRVSDVN